jgi:hypothetical protein
VHPDRSSLDPQLPGDGGGVEIEEDSQRDHLTLPGRQAPYRREQGGIEATAEVAGSRQVVVSQGQFAAAPPPPRRPGVKRGAHHPRPRGWMAADLPPRQPGSGERLRDLVFGHLRTADDSYHRPQAGLPAVPEELRELRLLVAHNPLTSTARRSAYLRAEIFRSRVAGSGIAGPGTGLRIQMARFRQPGAAAIAFMNTLVPPMYGPQELAAPAERRNTPRVRERDHPPARPLL